MNNKGKILLLLISLIVLCLSSVSCSIDENNIGDDNDLAETIIDGNYTENNNKLHSANRAEIQFHSSEVKSDNELYSGNSSNTRFYSNENFSEMESDNEIDFAKEEKCVTTIQASENDVSDKEDDVSESVTASTSAANAIIIGTDNDGWINKWY